MTPPDVWYGELLVQLGAGGIFALAILWIVLRFLKNPKDQRKENGRASMMQYMETTVTPRLDKLQNGHECLIRDVAKLPERDEIQGHLDAIHRRINYHESQCKNYNPKG